MVTESSVCGNMKNWANRWKWGKYPLLKQVCKGFVIKSLTKMKTDFIVKITFALYLYSKNQESKILIITSQIILEKKIPTSESTNRHYYCSLKVVFGVINEKPKIPPAVNCPVKLYIYIYIYIYMCVCVSQPWIRKAFSKVPWKHVNLKLSATSCSDFVLWRISLYILHWPDVIVHLPGTETTYQYR